YSYETAVLGVLQRILGIARAGTGVSLQLKLTYYYNAAISTGYMRRLAKEGLLIGCGVAIFALAGGWVIEIGGALFAHLQIANMLSALAGYWFTLGAVCMAEYLFFHLSYFALGLNRNFLRVAAPAVGLAILVAAGFGGLWFQPHDALRYALLSYIL